MGLFVDKDTEFTVTIAIAKGKANPEEIFCDISKEKLLEIYQEDIDPATIEEHTVWCSYPDFGTTVSIIDKSIEIQKSEVQLRLSAVRLNKMIALIKRWTFNDKKGNPVSPTSETIKSLNPHVAAILGIQIDMVLGEGQMYA